MNESDVIAIVAVCIAGLALIQSWLANRKASKASREANRLLNEQVMLQGRLTQLEESRENARAIRSLQADLRVELQQASGSSWQLRVMNGGQGTARNVAIAMDGKPLLQHKTIPRNTIEAHVIGPESEVSYPMAISSSTPKPPFELEVTWDDDSGERGCYRTTLTR